MSSEAVQLALAMHREPGRTAELRERGLPDDVGLLIRVAAGESGALDACAESTGYPPEHLLDASVFYLQQVLFAPGADPYQVLGVAPDAPQEQLREHYRWLIRWLHPDRNTDGWEAVYADRVNAAWQQVKTEARRAEYDAQGSHASTALVPVPGSYAGQRRPQLHPTHSGGPLLSGALVRRLPVLIIGGMAVTAAGVLGLMFLAQSDARREAERSMQKAQAAAEQRIAESPVTDAVPAAAALTLASVAPAADLMPVADAQAEPDVADAPADTTASSEPALVVDFPHSPGALALQAPRTRPGSDSPVVADVPASTQTLVQRPQAPATAVPTPATTQAPRVPARAVVTAPALSQPTMVARAPEPAPAIRVAAEPPLAVASSVSRTTAVPGVTVVQSTTPAPAPAPAPAPMAATTPNPEVAPQSRPLGPESRSGARTLVADLVQAFAAGNLSQFDALFIHTSRHELDVDALRRAMRGSQMRYLELGDISWDWHDDSVHGRAAYRQTVLPAGAKKAVTESGEMRWVLRMDSDRWRISSLVLASASRN